MRHPGDIVQVDRLDVRPGPGVVLEHFPVRALQVDGGSEFQASFEQACAEHGIRLFVLPPHSPKLNGHVECAQRTPAEYLMQYTSGLGPPSNRSHRS